MVEINQRTAATSDLPAKSWWSQIALGASRTARFRLAVLTSALIAGIGLCDFHFGFELSFQVFYIVPVCLAVASVGWRFGTIAAILSVTSAGIGDALAGAHYSQPWVPWGNAAFALSTYLAVVWLFQSLLTLQRELEDRVLHRTATLQSLISERERLEKAVLEISERERRSIGHDLHDGLGQHLTGTALAAQVTVEKLQAKKLAEEEADVRQLIDHIEEAIEKTRRLAKGLLLAEIEPEAFPAALQELASDVSGEFQVRCEFYHEGQVRVRDIASATHLFHIAKEAVHNAIRHGKARRIAITLATSPHESALSIADHGSGLPPPAARGRGLGLSIMAHRAEIIGWTFNIAARAGGGTTVTCWKGDLSGP